jgi:hypothetical protein
MRGRRELLVHEIVPMNTRTTKAKKMGVLVLYNSQNRSGDLVENSPHASPRILMESMETSNRYVILRIVMMVSRPSVTEKCHGVLKS